MDTLWIIKQFQSREKQLLRHDSHPTLEQVLEYEAPVFHHRTRTKEHYEAVCRTLEQIQGSKR
jgi:hypothetical protein